MTLYELNHELLNFDLEIDEETGEILNAADLDKLEMERDTKIENIGLWIKNLLSDAEELKREKDNLAKREQQAKKKAERLKEYLADNLMGEKFKTARLDISWRRSESVAVYDEPLIPDEYKIPQDPKIDKAGIKKALKEGIKIDGVDLITKSNIQIK